ncbi:putative membrane protein YphA (DoxX/SURF4 family) [Marmoricola sp. URHA0025 HA25]
MGATTVLVLGPIWAARGVTIVVCGVRARAYVGFVKDTWESLVVPHQTVFIGLLVAFEAVAGAAVLFPGRVRRSGLVALIAFNVALVSFGWGFLLWAVPVATGLVLLLRAESRRASRTSGPTPRPKGRHVAVSARGGGRP